MFKSIRIAIICSQVSYIYSSIVFSDASGLEVLSFANRSSANKCMLVLESVQRKGVRRVREFSMREGEGDPEIGEIGGLEWACPIGC